VPGLAAWPARFVARLLFDVVVFDGADELDVIGPLEVLRRAQVLGTDLRARLCSQSGSDPVTCAFGLQLHPEATFVPGEAGVVVVPGGGWVAHAEAGVWAEAQRGELPRLLGEASQRGSVMAGVCTGALLLAHAGLVAGRRAATHHDARADLAGLGATVVGDRVVDEGNLVTSGGVTSGIDLGLWLVARYFGEGLAGLVAEGLEYNWALPLPARAAS
jgi:transcriptional regulator GlxA family with amidase domain